MFRGRLGIGWEVRSRGIDVRQTVVVDVFGWGWSWCWFWLVSRRLWGEFCNDWYELVWCWRKINIHRSRDIDGWFRNLVWDGDSFLSLRSSSGSSSSYRSGCRERLCGILHFRSLKRCPTDRTFLRPNRSLLDRPTYPLLPSSLPWTRTRADWACSLYHLP
jgi:hypothetical protein